MGTRWEDLSRHQGAQRAQGYAERFERLAAQGADVHGEAALVTTLAPPPARILDAGCGTGRVAIRLAELGHPVVGIDLDAEMVAVAESAAPDLEWRVADLSDLADLMTSGDLGEQFDLVVVAGNVPPLLAPGTLGGVAAGLAAAVVEGGPVVLGFGLDSAHLPHWCPPLPLEEYDAAMAAAGLVSEHRWSSWDRVPFADDQGYLVDVRSGRHS